MGHNLDFPGSADKAISVFNNILNKDPDNSRANYLYGGFLASTKLQAKSIPFLQKAIKLGIKEANYSLFSVYASQNKISEAITHLEEYLKHYPSKEYTELLHTLKSGNFKIKNVIVD